MFQEGLLDKTLRNIKKLIPRSVFDFFAPAYHTILAYAGAVAYGFPSRSMKVIGVTGTKGKSTTVFLITKILEQISKNVEGRPVEGPVEGGPPQGPQGFLWGGVAAIGSLGFKIKDKEWPNTLKMTMPGRFKLQKFLVEAKRAGCKYVVLEVTSEGIKQKRHLGIKFDCAVFTNLHKEHIESHGSFENYYRAKQDLFKKTQNIHIINADDPNTALFGDFPAKHKIFYGLNRGDMVASIRQLADKNENIGSSFEIYGTTFSIKLAGQFNVLNCLAALSVGAMYGIDLPKMKTVLESIEFIPGRMEFIPAFVRTSAGETKRFNVVVDYAHTPESLIQVYQTLKLEILNPKSEISSKFQIPNSKPRLICVLGAAGGGRDKWKRPEFGRIAAEYCDEIILTNEDPYDENPFSILKEIENGFSQLPITNYQLPKYKIILDRREAIRTALTSAQEGDAVVITGKGSEMSMAVAGGKKIPWSHKNFFPATL